MKVTLISIPVRDQEKALKFYTEKLGFLKKKDQPLEGGNRWITLVSPEWQDGPELLLEPAPNHFEPCKVFQDALMEAGFPYTQFDVDDVEAEYEKLIKLDVDFSVKPTKMGTVKFAVFNDTCGNNIQIVEML
ncbi:VOC family protein [Winogradskyella immobilis]|uniref:VOC family protein n=1 Tax=Winogradskyella immobilis TaxID=2816852 RepID=A0ABS8ENY3_9FLAO|nr:VOC family protein [Winogradskyella immobilis]MCC1484928.1 VOC family protein [Winogradskyella immobilis]MCG0017020.1 VOC family protein [Winogradskyella immobilis]